MQRGRTLFGTIIGSIVAVVAIVIALILVNSGTPPKAASSPAPSISASASSPTSEPAPVVIPKTSNTSSFSYLSDLVPSGNLGQLVNPGPVKIDGSIYPKSILFYCNVGDPTAFPAYKLEHNARRRDTVDAIRYLVREGIRWRAMPADFPHWRTAYDALDGWGKSGATEAMHDELRRACRIAAGREPEPTAAVIDSQSVRAAETVAAASRGFDAGKKVQGRKRHIAVDTTGLLLTVLITAAGLQDRDAAKPLLRNLKKAFPAVRLAWADGGYAGKLVSWAKTALKLTLQIVRRPDDLHTFQVLPRRWVVERTLAWITRHRRTVRDYERLPAHHETIIYWAMIITMTRRLARRSRPVPALVLPQGRPALSGG